MDHFAAPYLRQRPQRHQLSHNHVSGLLTNRQVLVSPFWPTSMLLPSVLLGGVQEYHSVRFHSDDRPWLARFICQVIASSLLQDYGQLHSLSQSVQLRNDYASNQNGNSGSAIVNFKLGWNVESTTLTGASASYMTRSLYIQYSSYHFSHIVPCSNKATGICCLRLEERGA